jgi:hypothetical protein
MKTPEETLRNMTEELTTPPWGVLGRDMVLGTVSGVNAPTDPPTGHHQLQRCSAGRMHMPIHAA